MLKQITKTEINLLQKIFQYSFVCKTKVNFDKSKNEGMKMIKKSKKKLPKGSFL